MLVSPSSSGAAAAGVFFFGLASGWAARPRTTSRVWNRLTRSCGRFGPATLGSTLARSRSQTLAVLRLGRRRPVEEALLARVRLDQLDVGGRSAREAQVAQRLVVDREDAAGGAVLGRHVGDGGAVGERQRRDARRRRTRRTSRRRPSCAASRSRSAPGRSPSSPRAACRASGSRPPAGSASTAAGPSIAASASMPPTPQPSTPRPLTIVVCESVPTSVSG